MAIEIIPVKTSKQKKLFLDFEWKVNKNTPNWISPLYIERKKILNTKKNPFYQHSEIELFLAFKNGRLSGRIAAVTNENYNKFHNDRAGFWGFFDAFNDQETANALFTAAADWLKARDRDQMFGPLNPSSNDECGMLIDGFDTPPFISMIHNADYYPKLAEGFGLVKAKDLYAWFIATKDANDNISEKMIRVSEKIMKRGNITLRNLVLKNLKTEIKLIKEIYNDAWSNNWGFVPFTEAEIDNVAADLKQIADENMLLIAEKNGEPIGFSVTIPNVNEVLAKIPKGRLFPTGIFKLISGVKKIKSLRVIILGIKKEHNLIGLGSIFYVESIRRAYKSGYKSAEMSWILEDNLSMNRAIESIGSKRYKTYRIYSYPLNDN
ncbi:MAG: hypothetical protein K8R79_11325 [Calditrichales bacterium]|nr:hypothetical protein [Calditrichales bacterium]